MCSSQRSAWGAVCLAISLTAGCQRGPGAGPSAGSGGALGKVGDDLKGVAKETEKTAKDIGHATVGLADKAGQRLEDLTNQAGTGSKDAWITTKVKSALTSDGLDPLHVHVDTSNRIVTLSGSVPSDALKRKAVSAARGVNDVADVKDHLFVKADGH